MKINQRYIILLVVVIFIAAAVFLYMSYSKQNDEKKLAEQSLNNANSSLNSVNKEKTDQENLLTETNNQAAQLQSQLIAAQQLLEQKQTAIPESIENIDYNELLFNIARMNQLKVISITTAGAEQNQVNNQALYVTTFAITVAGSYAGDILTFINDITNDSNFISCTIDSLAMTENTQEVEGVMVTSVQGNFNLSLYGYKE